MGILSTSQLLPLQSQHLNWFSSQLQVMVTEDEVSQMSPEELAAFQRQNCVFCQIAAGRVPAKNVYSDDDCIAVLDINPASSGHMLLMPKEHYSVMPQVPAPVVEHLFMVCKGLSQAALKSLQCRGTTVFVANGVAAGQRAPHFMIHIIPRSDGDNVNLGIPSRGFQKKQSEAVAALLRKALMSNIKEGVLVEKPAGVKEEKAAKKPVKKQVVKKKSEKKQFDLDEVAKLLSK